MARRGKQRHLKAIENRQNIPAASAREWAIACRITLR